MTSSVSPVYCPLIQQMANTSSEPSNTTAKMSSLSVFTFILHGFVSTAGIAENLLILGVVVFHVRRTVISTWIINLAFSDLLATASLPFFTLFMARGNTWTLGTTFCRIHSSIFFLNMFVSSFLLAAISLDRCVVVLRPVWAQNYRNIRLVWKICGLIWILALICVIPFYVFRDTIPHRSGRILCYYNYARLLPTGQSDLASLCKWRQGSLALMKLFVAFLIPMLLIVMSYVAVSATLVRRSCRRPYRFVRLVVAVVVSYVICWAPYQLFGIMEVASPNSHPVQQFATRALPVAASISFLNSVLNPFLYVFSCPDLCSKIRQSLGAVMENVLTEDLAELVRRRSIVHNSNSVSEVVLKKKNSLQNVCLKVEEEEQENGCPHSTSN